MFSSPPPLTTSKRYILCMQQSLNTDTLHKSKKILPKWPLSHIATLVYFFAKLPAWWFIFFWQIDSEDVSIIAKLPVPIFFFAKCFIRHIASDDIRQIEGIPPWLSNSLAPILPFHLFSNVGEDVEEKRAGHRIRLAALGSPQSSPSSFAETSRDLTNFCLSSQFYFEWFFSYSEGPSYVPLTLPHSYFLVTNLRVFSLMEKNALFNSFLFSLSILRKTGHSKWSLDSESQGWKFLVVWHLALLLLSLVNVTSPHKRGDRPGINS